VKHIRIRHHRLAIVAGVVIAAVVIVVLVAWLVSGRGSAGDESAGGTESSIARSAVLPQGGIYHSGQATIVVDGYWKQRRAQGYEALSGSFPCLRVTVSCTEDCSLLLEPVLRFPDSTWINRRPSGLPLQEEVDLAAGETRSIVWVFDVVAGAGTAQLEIEVHDRTGQADSGQAVFELEKPGGLDPWSTTTTTGP
jgi:hypothetical protein